MKKPDVVTFGEAMAMFMANEIGPLSRNEQFTRSLAGAETNVAIGLARLEFQVKWMSKVGDDAFGQYIVEQLQSEGIDTSGISIDKNYPTGFQIKSKVAIGDPEVQYFRKNSAASKLQITSDLEEHLLSARHLHMTGIPPALSDTMLDFARKAAQLMKAANRTISFDPNLRPKLWDSEYKMVQIINELAFQADYVLPGLSEGTILTGYSDPRDIAAFYLERGVRLVVVKLGADGAYFRTVNEEQMIPGFQVAKIIDTVGAGDGFAVGIISALLEGLSIREAVTRANAIGALAVMSPGDSDGLPTRMQLEKFIQSQRSTENAK
jgi:sugar/nucleoside kinase (ribokinase family)